MRDLTIFQDGPIPYNWQRHTTWRRHLPNPRVLPRALCGTAPLVLWTALVSALVTCYVELLQPKAGWPQLSKPTFPIVFSLTSFALSLLLVYRTSAAYGRWAEMRTACGKMMWHLRNIVRLANSCMDSPADQAARDALLRWNVALAPLFFGFLGSSEACYEIGKGVLTAEEMQLVRAAKHPPPVLALAVMSRLLKSTRLDPWERLALEHELSGVDGCLGIGQKLGLQPIPLAYTRHTSRFLVVWLTFLPFALACTYSWATVPIVAVVTFLLAGVEGIGVCLENPLHILPLRSYTAGFKAALLAQVAEAQVAAKLANDVLDAGVGKCGAPTDGELPV